MAVFVYISSVTRASGHYRSLGTPSGLTQTVPLWQRFSAPLGQLLRIFPLAISVMNDGLGGNFVFVELIILVHRVVGRCGSSVGERIMKSRHDQNEF